MTLLEMLDVLEVGCTTLQQRSSELAAALSQARDNVIPQPEAAPKRQPPSKRKRKATKGKRSTVAKKTRAAKSKTKAPAVETAAVAMAAAPGSAGQEGPKVGKRQALGKSFSALRASLQARRLERRGEEPSQAAE